MVGASSTLAGQFQSLPVFSVCWWLCTPTSIIQTFSFPSSCQYPATSKSIFLVKYRLRMKENIGIGESGFDSYHPKYINCELCTLAIIIYTINKIHLVAKQHLSLILDLSGGIWPLDLRNLKFHPACRTCFSGPGRSNLLFLPCTYLPWLESPHPYPHLWHEPSSPGHSQYK